MKFLLFIFSVIFLYSNLSLGTHLSAPLVAPLSSPLIGSSAAPLAGDQGRIKNFISTETANIISIISDKQKTDQQKTQQLTDVFLKMVDAQWMAKFTLGMHWKELSKEQSKKFIDAYRTYLVNYYVPNFKKYKSNIFKIESVNELRKNEFLVKTIIKGSDDITNYSVDFRLIDKNGTIQIFDILTEGISIISTQRAEFNAIINKYGIEYLIDKLSS